MPLKGVSAPNGDTGLPWKRGVEGARKWLRYALAKWRGEEEGQVCLLSESGRMDLRQNHQKLIKNPTVCQAWGPPVLIQLDKQERTSSLLLCKQYGICAVHYQEELHLMSLSDPFWFSIGMTDDFLSFINLANSPTIHGGVLGGQDCVVGTETDYQRSNPPAATSQLDDPKWVISLSIPQFPQI